MIFGSTSGLLALHMFDSVALPSGLVPWVEESHGYSQTRYFLCSASLTPLIHWSQSGGSALLSQWDKASCLLLWLSQDGSTGHNPVKHSWFFVFRVKCDFWQLPECSLSGSSFYLWGEIPLACLTTASRTLWLDGSSPSALWDFGSEVTWGLFCSSSSPQALWNQMAALRPTSVHVIMFQNSPQSPTHDGECHDAVCWGMQLAGSKISSIIDRRQY